MGKSRKLRRALGSVLSLARAPGEGTGILFSYCNRVSIARLYVGDAPPTGGAILTDLVCKFLSRGGLSGAGQSLLLGQESLRISSVVVGAVRSMGARKRAFSRLTEDRGYDH